MLTAHHQLTCTPEQSEHLVLTQVTVVTLVTVELASVRHLVTRQQSSVRELYLTAGVLASLIQVINNQWPILLLSTFSLILISTLFSDCPSNGLCCFDGCADTCVDGPTPAPVTLPPVTTPAFQPVEAEQEEEEIPEVVSESKPASVSPAGYSYPVPDIPFDLPVPSRPPPDLPTLYEVPF